MDRKKNSLEVMLTRVVGDFLVKYLGVKVYFLLAPFIISPSQISLCCSFSKSQTQKILTKYIEEYQYQTNIIRTNMK
jgi:hypothetical protein